MLLSQEYWWSGKLTKASLHNTQIGTKRKLFGLNNHHSIGEHSKEVQEILQDIHKQGFQPNRSRLSNSVPHACYLSKKDQTSSVIFLHFIQLGEWNQAMTKIKSAKIWIEMVENRLSMFCMYKCNRAHSKLFSFLYSIDVDIYFRLFISYTHGIGGLSVKTILLICIKHAFEAQ